MFRKKAVIVQSEKNGPCIGNTHILKVCALDEDKSFYGCTWNIYFCISRHFTCMCFDSFVFIGNQSATTCMATPFKRSRKQTYSFGSQCVCGVCVIVGKWQKAQPRTTNCSLVQCVWICWKSRWLFPVDTVTVWAALQVAGIMKIRREFTAAPSADRLSLQDPF